jgi:hypothetical protein
MARTILKLALQIYSLLVKILETGRGENKSSHEHPNLLSGKKRNNYKM